MRVSISPKKACFPAWEVLVEADWCAVDLDLIAERAGQERRAAERHRGPPSAQPDYHFLLKDGKDRPRKDSAPKK